MFDLFFMIFANTYRTAQKNNFMKT